MPSATKHDVFGACNESVETFTVMQLNGKKGLACNFENEPIIYFSVIFVDPVYF